MAVMVTVSDLAEQMHVKKNRIYEWARREEDPLPLRTMDGMTRSSALVVEEWVAWYKRNSRLFKEVER